MAREPQPINIIYVTSASQGKSLAEARRVQQMIRKELGLPQPVEGRADAEAGDC